VEALDDENEDDEDEDDEDSVREELAVLCESFDAVDCCCCCCDFRGIRSNQ
jgi:hypothetical protein